MTADPLLQPFTLKHLTLLNRIITTAHEPAYPENGMPTARYRAYHVERAKAGVAMVMTAGSATVAKDSPPAFNNILAYQDEVVPHIQALTDACHEHGTAVMIQLTHLGRRTTWDKGDWLPSLAPTLHREPAHRASAKLIEDWDIQRIINDYATAAERMQAGGMDGIELEAYGHLIDQFWSPLTNQLDGPYDASTLDNRLRFALDVLRAIRARVGGEFIVGIRMVADEAEAGGLSRDDGLAIAQRLRESGLIDFINVIRGRIHTDAALTGVIPVQGMASSPHLNFAGELKQHTGIATLHAARIGDVATARHAIAEGLIDLVGMTRAHMADPHIVQKITQGREADIRPCVGATYCLDRIYQGGEALCIHNPSTGRERELPHHIPKAKTAKTVVVVGAGPGGLEAARVAAERGHHVHLIEAAPQAGGQVRLLTQSAHRREMISIIDWRLDQCTKLGVSMQFNTWADADTVLSYAPDVVIVATGGLPKMSLLERHDDLDHVVNSWDVLSGDVKLSGKVLIYDEAGDHAAQQAAQLALDSGCQVDLITPDRTLSADIMAMNLVPYLRSTQHKPIQHILAQRLLQIEPQGRQLRVTLGTDYSNHQRTADYDHIVFNAGTVPLAELYFDLKPLSRNGGEVDYDALITGNPQTLIKHPNSSFQLFRIGDAVSSRNIHAAVYDAMRLGVTL